MIRRSPQKSATGERRRTLRLNPLKTQLAIWITREAEGAWLVLTPRGHGWLFGDYAGALDDARWLSANLSLPIRVQR